MRVGSTFASLFLAALWAGCGGEPAWEKVPVWVARDADVSAALGDFGHDEVGIAAADVPVVPLPGALRPCCAFGKELRVKLGGVPVPRFRIGNITERARLGPHRFNNGAISVDSKDRRGALIHEANGIVFTCRGGFVDIAHVRDKADLTLHLASQVARRFETGMEEKLLPQGAELRVIVDPLSPELVLEHGRRELAIGLGQWLAYQEGIWHEIATWYGYASLAAWPEKISAFSPEDLYSNALGIRIAGEVVREDAAQGEVNYNENMDIWIDRALERLGARDTETGRLAMRAVDGRWWDSQRRIPNFRLTLRRLSVLDTPVVPWQIDTGGDPERVARVREACAGQLEAHPLPLDAEYADLRFADFARLEIEVGDALAAAGFPFPREGSRSITQADFPFVVAAFRRENEQALGADANRP